MSKVCIQCIYQGILDLHSVLSLSKEEDPSFENFKKGGPEKRFWVGKPKGGKIFKNNGGNTFFWLNLGIEKNKSEDF